MPELLISPDHIVGSIEAGQTDVLETVAAIDKYIDEKYAECVKREIIRRVVEKRAVGNQAILSMSRRKRTGLIPQCDTSEAQADAIRAHFIGH